MICYNYDSTSDIISEQVCMYCNSDQELTTILVSDICYSCREFIDCIICKQCKTQKQEIARPCINCQRVIYSERILMKKESLSLENPDEIKNKNVKNVVSVSTLLILRSERLTISVRDVILIETTVIYVTPVLIHIKMVIQFVSPVRILLESNKR